MGDTVNLETDMIGKYVEKLLQPERAVQPQNGITLKLLIDVYKRQPYKGEISRRGNGSIISFETGESITYGLYNAQERGTLFIGAGVPVYGGMIIGVSPRSEDMTVNVCKKKQLTNTRASGSDDALRLVPPRQMSLEQCLEFLADDCLLYTSYLHAPQRRGGDRRGQGSLWGARLSSGH